MDMRLHGRSALITGGSKGIGFCIAGMLDGGMANRGSLI